MSSEDFDGQVIEPLDLGGRPFTARAIADWHECPMKFMLSQFVGHAASRRFIGGPAALHQAVRDALVECYRLEGPAGVPLPDLLAMFDTHWDGSLCADSLEEERLHAHGRRMLSDYHAGHAQARSEILDVDARLEVELGGHRFVAVADVILREQDGGVNALRWLTTGKPPSLNDMSESPSWGLLFVAARERYPDDDVSVTMYSLRRGSGHRVSYTDEQLGPIVRRLTAAADRITVATEFPTNTGTHCRWCRARGRCPALR